jgi:hypothetical protein
MSNFFARLSRLVSGRAYLLPPGKRGWLCVSSLVLGFKTHESSTPSAKSSSQFSTRAPDDAAFSRAQVLLIFFAFVKLRSLVMKKIMISFAAIAICSSVSFGQIICTQRSGDFVIGVDKNEDGSTNAVIAKKAGHDVNRLSPNMTVTSSRDGKDYLWKTDGFTLRVNGKGPLWDPYLTHLGSYFNGTLDATLNGQPLHLDNLGCTLDNNNQ